MSENWIDAVALADVPEGDVIGVQVGGKEIAYTKLKVKFLPLTTSAHMAMRA